MSRTYFLGRGSSSAARKAPADSQRSCHLGSIEDGSYPLGTGLSAEGGRWYTRRSALFRPARGRRGVRSGAPAAEERPGPGRFVPVPMNDSRARALGPALFLLALAAGAAYAL